MRVTSLLLALLVVTRSSTVPAATAPDLAIFNVVHQTDPALVSYEVVYRHEMAPDLNLVIAIASTAEGPVQSGPDWFYWEENQKLGLFLQQITDPDRVYSLTFASGFPDCTASIERATVTDTVVSCTPEKGNESIFQKFVYDVRSKRLVSHFEYKPVELLPVPDASGRTVFVGSDSQKLIVVEWRPDKSPEFRFLSKGEAIPWLAHVGTNQGKVYLLPDESTSLRFGKPLPKPTHEDLAKARPELLKAYGSWSPTIEESIGPIEPEGDKLWFGKAFYDSEGVSGVGGFGYFDAADHQYHLYSPPEVADFSISAIRVEPGAVWMGIYRRGEYGDGAGGILRYDRETHIVRKYDLPDIVNGLVVSRDRVIAGTDSGIAIIEGDQTRRYFVDRTTDGRLRIAEASR
jgi:hypothetical protein